MGDETEATSSTEAQAPQDPSAVARSQILQAGGLVWIDRIVSVHAHVQSHPLPRFRVHLKHSR
jgi:hypothetical protein